VNEAQPNRQGDHCDCVDFGKLGRGDHDVIQSRLGVYGTLCRSKSKRATSYSLCEKDEERVHEKGVDIMDAEACEVMCEYL
jgi:hypothetical protein